MHIISSFIKRRSFFAILFLICSIAKSDAQTEADSLGEIVSFCEEMPDPVGGQESVSEYIKRNLRPQSDENGQNITGKVILSFVITKTGKIVMVKNVVPPNTRLIPDVRLVTEAIRVFEQIPDWKPGKQNGKEVNVRMSMPILFR